jgi:hypothetical protein
MIEQCSEAITLIYGTSECLLHKCTQDVIKCKLKKSSMWK